MKNLCIIVMCVIITACGTVGGTVSGMGSDLTKAGEWIRNR